MFTNKHVIAALLVTPILAITAYFAVDHYVSEKPHSAVTGGTYKLIAKSNCRYGSGLCDLQNGDMQLAVSIEEQAHQVIVKLDSAIPLSGVRLSLTDTAGAEAQPIALRAAQNDPRKWQGRFNLDYSGDEVLRLVVSAGGAFYFGETVAAFGRRDNPYGEQVSATND